MFLKRILYYLNPATLFRKSEPTTDGEEGNMNLRAMHGINRISILMFLAGMVVLAVKSCGR